MLKVIYKKRHEILPYHRNPRKNKAAIDKVVASLKEFDWQQPIVVDSEMVVIVGHTRLLAAEQLGMDEVPIHIAENLTPEQIKAYRLMDNRSHEEAEWDKDLLSLELGDLDGSGFDLALTGFNPDELQELLDLGDEVSGLTDDDEVGDPPCEAISKPGDVWLLGKHRVMCGDSTNLTEMFTLMSGDMAEMIFTDPPYNVNYEGSAGKIKNDSMDDSQFYQFLFDAFATMYVNLSDGGAVYIAHADTEGLNFRKAYSDAAFKISGCLIWRKNALVLGRSDYQWQHEPILYGWKPGAAHRYYGGRKQTTLVEFDNDALIIEGQDDEYQIRLGDETAIIRGDNLTIESVISGVVYHEKPSRSDKHPTMKPVSLVQKFIENSSRVGEIVLDPFGGSGSTMIACEKTGRLSRLMELDPKFVDVIVTRWQEYTGRNAIHQDSGIKFNDMASKCRAA